VLHRVRIEGMHCDGCVARLRRLVAADPALRLVSAELGHLEVEADPTHRERISALVQRAGWRVSGHDEH
jgi:copper chaperone CopZ